tara:strand:+ start:252 stop:650 length:399 start_codon:yes stop_codon:yes gene_type:complete
MNIAKLVADRGTCPRLKVGAVLVYKNSIVAAGYNGSLPNSPHCLDVGCMVVNNHCLRTIHAEMNAVLHLEHRYDDLTLYCTHKPCYQCTKGLLMSNVSIIYFKEDYEDVTRDKLIEEYPKRLIIQQVEIPRL